MLYLTSIWIFLLFAISSYSQVTIHPVQPSGKTQFGYETGDADDPCVWIHPSQPGMSTIIGTDKDNGISVFDLEGKEIQHLRDGELNNVDIRYGFKLGNQTVDIVTAGNRTDNTIMVYAVNPETRHLQNIAARPLKTKLVVYGSCMYHSRKTNQYYCFINSQEGEVEQWELFDNGSGKVDAKPVRTFDVGTQTEGCVADDELRFLYIGEEDLAIWKYGAEPDAGSQRSIVDKSGDHFTADVEGLTIYYGPNGTGYLIASSQGDSSYIVYTREGSNKFVMKFTIVDGNGFDAVAETDGLDVCNVNLGESYPHGIFVAHDGPDKNYKMVKWEDIAKLAEPPLLIDTTWNPRNPLK